MSGKVTSKSFCPKCEELGHEQANDDNLSNFDNHSSHCFVCGHDEQEGVETVQTGVTIVNETTSTPTGLIKGHVSALPDRCLTKESCEKYNVRTGTYTGMLNRKQVVDEEVIIFPIYEEGQVVRQKIRGRADKKRTTQLGDTTCTDFFGQNRLSPTKKVPIYITEGEFDAMAGFQLTGYAFVSVVNGSGSLLKELKANYEWLIKWKHISIVFDNDKAGKEAVKKISSSSLFEPGFIKVVSLPLKDANEMLVAGRELDFKNALFSGKMLKPETMLSVDDLVEQALVRPEMGSPWPWETFTKVTCGMRPSEVYLLAAAKGVGKTQFCQELVTQQLDNGNHVGLFSLEQDPADSLIRFVGSRMNLKLHIPGCRWDEDAIKREIDNLKGKVTLYNRKAGVPCIESVVANIRFTAVCHGGKLFIIDNLTALAIRPRIDGKRVNKVEYMSHVMNELTRVADELGVTVFVIQHLNTSRISLSAKMTTDAEGEGSAVRAPDGTSWRKGRIPDLTNIYGSGEVSNLCTHTLVLARNCESDDKEARNTTLVKFLTTRLDGQYDGKTFKLRYNTDTGRLSELTAEDERKELGKDGGVAGLMTDCSSIS